MSAALPASQDPSAARSFGGRGLMFLGAIALVFISLRPFEDLSKEDVVDIATGRDVYNYILMGLMAAICVLMVNRHDRPALRSVMRWPYLALAACVCVTSVLSGDPSTSIRRAALTLFLFVIAAAMPLLPRSRAHLATLLALGAAVVLALCYFGVVFLPNLSIHQAIDVAEPDLAGDWRGVYGHKNVAAATCGMLAFVGVFIYRTGQQLPGIAITLAALVFVYFTHSKTSTSLWAPAFLLGLLPYSRLWAFASLVPLLVINIFGVGAQALPMLKPVAKALPFDSTFTGRADLWALAVDRIEAKPVLGYGFDSYWNNTDIHFNNEIGWLAGAANAHNSYVDAALGMGMVGLGLLVVAAIILPLRDIATASRRGADPMLLALFSQIWLFGIWASSLETFFFNRVNPVWFLFLVAMFGLRYLSTFSTVD